MAFKKSFFLAILIAFLNIQFVLAMDKEDEELGWSISNLLNNANKRLGQAADLMDVVNGAGPPESVLPIQQSTTPFFEELPDDIALCVFSQLCKTEQPLQELRAVALTCRKGHHLTQDPSLWEPFKKTYFADFPVEYMVTLIESTIRQGFPLARTLLQQHLTYQLKEMAWLKEMLSTHHERRIEPEILHSPLKKIHYEIKNGLFNKLIETEKLNKNKSPLEIYFSQEETLDFINSEIIQACLKLSKRELRKQTIDGVVMNYNWAQINLSCALTRVPREAVNFMVETLSLSNIDEVMISLSYNRLRWIPDELFSNKKLNKSIRSERQYCDVKIILTGVSHLFPNL